MEIRREMALDAPKIRAVNMAAFGSPTEADIIDSVRSNTRDLVSLIAEGEGAIVGHIMFSARTSGTGHRNSGDARRGWAGRGAGAIVVLSLLEANPRARPLYERLGFQVTALESPFVRMRRRRHYVR